MPIYEYTCKACGNNFEVLQKISDKPVRKCEACGKLKAQRQISQTSFVLKGTGWYTTDYAGHKAHGGSDSEVSTPSTSTSASEPTKSTATESSKSTATETVVTPPKSSSKKAANA